MVGLRREGRLIFHLQLEGLDGPEGALTSGDWDWVEFRTDPREVYYQCMICSYCMACAAMYSYSARNLKLFDTPQGNL
jgi:hypothetical protein